MAAPDLVLPLRTPAFFTARAAPGMVTVGLGVSLGLYLGGGVAFVDELNGWDPARVLGVRLGVLAAGLLAALGWRWATRPVAGAPLRCGPGGLRLPVTPESQRTVLVGWNEVPLVLRAGPRWRRRLVVSTRQRRFSYPISAFTGEPPTESGAGGAGGEVDGGSGGGGGPGGGVGDPLPADVGLVERLGAAAREHLIASPGGPEALRRLGAVEGATAAVRPVVAAVATAALLAAAGLGWLAPRLAVELPGALELPPPIWTLAIAALTAWIGARVERLGGHAFTAAAGGAGAAAGIAWTSSALERTGVWIAHPACALAGALAVLLGRYWAETPERIRVPVAERVTLFLVGFVLSRMVPGLSGGAMLMAALAGAALAHAFHAGRGWLLQEPDEDDGG